MRGLFFIEKGRRIRSDATVMLESTDGLTAEHPDMLIIADVFNRLEDRRDGVVGKAFSYVGGFGFGVSAWIMLLYDYFFWMGTIDERPIAEREEPMLPAAPIIIRSSGN
jgi:hypothetical protein